MGRSKKNKGRKILDESNVCRCGGSGGKGIQCPLVGVIPPFDDAKDIKPCNCCNACYSRCADEV